MTVTLAKIRKVGNSKGIIFPKSILDKTGIGKMVRITVQGKTITITPIAAKSRKTWDDFKKKKRNKIDFVTNEFDSAEWTW